MVNLVNLSAHLNFLFCLKVSKLLWSVILSYDPKSPCGSGTKDNLFINRGKEFGILLIWDFSHVQPDLESAGRLLFPGVKLLPLLVSVRTSPRSPWGKDLLKWLFTNSDPLSRLSKGRCNELISQVFGAEVILTWSLTFNLTGHKPRWNLDFPVDIWAKSILSFLFSTLWISSFPLCFVTSSVCASLRWGRRQLM